MPTSGAKRYTYSDAPWSAAPSAPIGSADAVPRMSIRSGEMSRMVCASATRPKILGALNDASMRATLRPNRYATEPSSIRRRPFGSRRAALAATLSAAVAMNPAWCGLDCAMFDVERLTQHGPAVVHVAQPVLVVDADVAVVHDVGAVAVDRTDALDFDARRIQRHQKHGQGLVLWRIRIGVGDQKDVLAVVGAGGEHLRAVDHPRVSVAHRAGLACRDVRAAFGLGIAETQPDMTAEHPWQHLVLQFSRAEPRDRPRHHRCR